jgi:translation initiation factor 2 alpha subunit (eIF-2alpha)
MDSNLSSYNLSLDQPKQSYKSKCKKKWKKKKKVNYALELADFIYFLKERNLIFLVFL